MALPLARYTGVAVTVGAGSALLVAPGATVTVYQSGTLVPATLFSDSAGLSPLSNPFVADGLTGTFSFCVGNGLYDLTVVGVGSPPYTIPAVQIVSVAPPVGQLLLATATFPHAQILTWPTTALTLVAAPGAGLTIVPLHIRLVVDTRAGAYTNIDAGATPGTGGFIELFIANGVNDTFSYLTNGHAGGANDLGEALITAFLGAVGQQLWEPRRFGMPADPSTDSSTNPFFNNGWGLLQDPTIGSWTAAQNQPFMADFTNGALGNLTGGAPANSLTATVAYLLLP